MTKERYSSGRFRLGLRQEYERFLKLWNYGCISYT
jgi:hypothetical protein